jgi:predicted O-methyltransferase YrrM
VSEQRWASVDVYLEALFGAPDEALEGALERAAAAGAPPISVSPGQGRLLALLARAVGARRVLEVGTLAGYSAIWLGRAVGPGGRVVTLELEGRWADLARENLERAGLGAIVEVRVGRALETLARMAGEGAEPFDFVFIDADKATTLEYFDLALGLARPGALVVVDNVVRGGAVADAASADPSVRGVRRFLAAAAADARVASCVVQTVGSKGYDGFAIALVAGGSSA